MATLRARKRQSSGGDSTLPNVTSSHDIFNNLLQKSFLRIICFRERRSEQPRPPVVNNEDVDEDVDESFEPSAAIAEDYGPSDKMESDDKYVNPDDVDRGNPTTLLPIQESGWEENASV
mmetsp:Transcript_35453/g.50269  ORF Transcript_35453/g.50269 Transcript_35453/m.50269 type:complete len:119 (+) Transcript_35453:3-359(+)